MRQGHLSLASFLLRDALERLQVSLGVGFFSLAFPQGSDREQLERLMGMDLNMSLLMLTNIYLEQSSTY